jgi:hypothetical protein
VEDELERILKARPNSALRKLGGGWPFHVEVESTLSGKALKTKMSFGEN